MTNSFRCVHDLPIFFPLCYSLRLQKLRNWYSHHSKKVSSEPKAQTPGPIAPVRIQVMPKPRKPIAILPWQGYSAVYCPKESPLRASLHVDFEGIKAGDQAAIAKYSHILSESGSQSPASIQWLTFYKLVMTDLFENLREDEQKSVTDHIQSRLEKDIRAYERPWDKFTGGEHDSEDVKMNNYIAK